MKYRDAIKVIDYVTANDGTLSLNPDDPSFEWGEARECVRRHEQRRDRRSQIAPQPDAELELTVTSDVEARSVVAAWEASPLTVVIGPIVAKLLVEEEGTE